MNNTIEFPIYDIPFDWPDRVPQDQWDMYETVLRAVSDAGIDFALGGAVALGAYTGQWRNTKDIDLYIVEEDRPRIVEVFASLGLQDYYGVNAYDRRWIYRAYNGETLVDAIWAMANQRAEVDRDWLRRGRLVDARGIDLRVLPPEELIWSKLYVMQRERCDWPDILNLLDATAHFLDWDRLVRRVGDDGPLLAGVLSVYRWLCPRNADLIPQVDGRERCPAERPRHPLLDSRPWFRGAQAA
ncbi:MAG: nucleotidyltransferase [Bryobacterales bacterium]|nr:nucleotidyltransferase [Bryobacterales bacterium]